MFNAVNILEALKNYIRTRGGQSAANNIAEAVNDLNSIPHGSGGGIPEAPIDDNQYARKNGDWSKVESSGGDIPDEVTNAIETHGMGWTSEEEVEGFDITWDGNTEGLDNVDDIFFKIDSDLHGITSVEDLIGASIEIEGVGIAVVTAEDIDTDDNKVYGLATPSVLGGSIDPVVVIAFEDGTYFDEVHTKGIWFGVLGSTYVSHLYKEATTEEVVHQIDQKYIPQSSGGGGMVVNITMEPDEVEEEIIITADKTYDEINNALLSGTPILAKVESFDIYSSLYGAVTNMIAKTNYDDGTAYIISFLFTAAGGSLDLSSTNEWKIFGA